MLLGRQELFSDNYIIRGPPSFSCKKRTALPTKKKSGATNGAPKFIFATAVNMHRTRSLFGTARNRR